jgi:hypothetical protein
MAGFLVILDSAKRGGFRHRHTLSVCGRSELMTSRMFAGTFAAGLFRPCALIAAKGLSARNLAAASGMLALVGHGSLQIPHIPLQQVDLR